MPKSEIVGVDVGVEACAFVGVLVGVSVRVAVGAWFVAVGVFAL
jgi:hypothetical protein